MSHKESVERERESGMLKRQITMADGRYLIFFTFEDEAGAASVDDGARSVEVGTDSRREPEVESEAEEERRV